MHRGETSGRRSRPRSIPEYLHKWKPPFQPGGNKSTQRHPGSQGETWRAKKRKPIQFHASLRVKTVTTGGTEKWPKEGGGTTGLTVSKTRHRHPPRTSHLLHETSQARFLHLDKTKVKSRKGQGIREGADLLPRRRGKQATINTCAEIRHRQGGLPTPARRLARQQSTKAAGRTTLRRLQ